MKKSLLTISALAIVASASSALAGQYNNSYGSYSYTPAYNNPYAQQASNQSYNQAAQYNNMQPASGSSAKADSSRWPYWYVGLKRWHEYYYG